VGDFLPSASRPAALVALRRLSEASAVANRWAATVKAQRLRTLSAPTTAIHFPTQSVAAPSPAAALIPLRLIAEAGLAMSTDTWTLALEKGTYDFTPSPGARPTLRDALLAEMGSQDPTLAALSSYATSVDGDRYCRYLQRRSQVALSTRTVATSPDWSLSDRTRSAHEATSTSLQPEQLLRVCAACHVSGVAPQIPFLQEPALKRALLSETTPRGRLLDEVLFRLSPDAADRRMPQGIRLSDEERGELEHYFVALVTDAR
jgi:hypothetical protein